MTLALSIHQPWAWAIINAGKDIENRVWSTHIRGRVLIHASKAMSDDDYDGCMDLLDDIRPTAVTGPGTSARLARRASAIHSNEARRGGIIGEVEIVDCVAVSDSPWFFGPYGFVLRNARPLPFRALKGNRRFFHVDEAALYGRSA